MSIVDDLDSDALISRLAGPLSPSNRAAFRDAAEQVIAGMVCPGPGVIYRQLAALQASYFVPPVDSRAAHWGVEIRPTKLKNEPPIGEIAERHRKQSL
jgi:hypothetical protein